MQFNTLENTSIADIAACMNAAFADYEIPIQWTEESLRQKIQVEDIHLPSSVGVFDKGILAGVTLVAIDEVDGTKRAWDGGTGVIPGYRGQKLTGKMFEHLLPGLQQAGVKIMLLEVLENNIPAYTVYERLGFKKTRLLRAYKGSISADNQHGYHVEELTGYNLDDLLRLSDCEPGWQQMNQRVLNRGADVTTICIKDGNKILAYAHYDKKAKRVHQFAVAPGYRRKGMAAALFSHIASGDNEAWLIVNIDAGSENTNAFLETIGLQNIISQYEMIKKL